MNVLWWLNYSLIVFTFAYLGACLASFWAVIAYRSASNLSWWHGRSFCDHCHRQLRWYDNLPLFSYVFLKGRCRYCQRQIAPIYWCWEFLVALCFAGFFIVNDQELFSLEWLSLSPTLIKLLANHLLMWLIIVLLWVSYQDIVWQRIANYWLLVLACLSFIHLSLQVYLFGWQLLLNRFYLFLIYATMLISFFYLVNALALYFYHQRGFGSGDIWVLLLLCPLLSWQQFLSLLLFAFWSGAIVGIIYLRANYLRFKKAKKRPTLPFLPFITFGFLLTLAFGEQFINYLFY